VSMNPVSIAYATRFGSTMKLAGQIAAGLQNAGATPQIVDVGEKPSLTLQPLVILTPIIWDRPIPAMRQ
jgi:menaquinone-dependent protoporphyrinogen IX oxidase